MHGPEGAPVQQCTGATRQFTLFAVDINDVTYIGYDADTSGQHVARWPAGLEYVRPSVTPTSLGPPRPVRRLLGG
jgi:hypothetical protein